MKSLSYIQLQDKYAGKFIAIYKGKVIASANTSKNLFEKVTDKVGDKNLLVQHIDQKQDIYNFNNLILKHYLKAASFICILASYLPGM